MNEPIHILSLGAGVQSSTLALMAAAGEITPMPVAAIFADTQAEPASVYKWLDWLEKQLPFPVERITRGNLAVESIKVHTSKTSGNRYTEHNIPAFIINPAGKIGIMNRHCTGDFKIDPITSRLRTLVGKPAMREWRNRHKQALSQLTQWKHQCADMKRSNKKLPKHERGPPPLRPESAWQECQADALVVQWIGISWDEIRRMKEGRHAWIRNTWPLIDKKITRQKCLVWMSQMQHPEPPRSACIFCPYHDDKEWLRMKEQDPESFAFAVQWEKQLQAAMDESSELEGKPYLHDTCKPLDTIDFTRPPDEQGSLFDNECEGMCGV